MSSPAGEPDLSACRLDTPSKQYPVEAEEAAARARICNRMIALEQSDVRAQRRRRDAAILDVLSAGVGVTDTSRLCGVSLSTVKQIRLRKGK